MARILLADDSQRLLNILAKSLRAVGHEVTSTNNGADAVCLIKTGCPPHDLMILDMLMPGLNGHDVLRALGPSAPPTVVISGLAVTAEEAAMPAVKRVLRKPFDWEDLKQAVESALAAAETETPVQG